MYLKYGHLARLANFPTFFSGEGSRWYEWSVNTSKSLQTIPFTDNSLFIGTACFAAALFCETLSGVNMN